MYNQIAILNADIAKDTAQEQEMKEYFKDRDFFDRSKIKGTGIISHMCKLENILNIPNEIVYFQENGLYEGIVLSLLNSENIKSQQGAFIFNANPYKPLEVVASDAWLPKNKSYNCRRFSEICYQCRSYGVRRRPCVF